MEVCECEECKKEKRRIGAKETRSELNRISLKRETLVYSPVHSNPLHLQRKVVMLACILLVEQESTYTYTHHEKVTYGPSWNEE